MCNNKQNLVYNESLYLGQINIFQMKPGFGYSFKIAPNKLCVQGFTQKFVEREAAKHPNEDKFLQQKKKKTIQNEDFLEDV